VSRTIMTLSSRLAVAMHIPSVEYATKWLPHCWWCSSLLRDSIVGQLPNSNNWIPSSPQVKIEDVVGENENPQNGNWAWRLLQGT
jgi:hypothetical protein